jgi:hypothetical protein
MDYRWMAVVFLLSAGCADGCNDGLNPRHNEDAGMDAGQDSGSSSDAGYDGGVDAAPDAEADSGFDGGYDAGSDSGVDGGYDAGSDPGTDAGIDAPVSCVGNVSAPGIFCSAGTNDFDLAISAVGYNSGTGQFTFDVAVVNHRSVVRGSMTDLRAFFHSGPTVTGGTGNVAVVPDGFATFTAAAQAYYQYAPVNATSASPPKTWTLVLPPTVTTFAFTIWLSP